MLNTQRSKLFFFLNGDVLDLPSQSPDLSPSEHVFHWPYIQTEGKRPQNKQEMDMAVVQAWQRITREHAKCVDISGFLTVPECKDLEPNNSLNESMLI